MKRIFLMFLRNFFSLFVLLPKLSYYAHHTEKYDDKFLYDFLQKITFKALKGGKVHVNVSGRDNLPKDQSFIFFPNHQGFFDVLAIIAVCDTPFSVVYKKQLKHLPFLSNVFKCLKSVDIDRDDLRQSLMVINDMANKVKDGKNFLIFAEGTRSRNGNSLLPFKGGTFKAAYKAKCPVVPVALIDTYKVFDTGSTDEVTVSVKFLPPIEYDDYKNLKTHELADLVHDNIEHAISSID